MGPISRESWAALEPLVDRALELTGDARRSFLTNLRQVDPTRAQEVERLVVDCDRPDPRLDTSAPDRFGYLFDDAGPLALAAGAMLGGRYRVEHEVGRGGMAIVYLARDVKLNDRPVAVKVMRRSHLTTASRRFQEEIRVTSNLRHPNIVQLYDAGDEQELEFFVMPFVEGETLRARLQREPEHRLTIADTLRIGIEIARALEYAHARGITHRDVKPSNLLLTSGVAMLADFGIARGDGTGESLTEVGARVGTPLYMSPEQALGDGVDYRTDIYSLGCVLYEAMTGAPPPPAVQRVAAKVTGLDSARPLQETRADVSPKLATCIGSAIATDLKQRTPTASALVAALEACARDYDVAVSRWKRLYWRAPRTVVAVALTGAALVVGGSLWLVRRETLAGDNLRPAQPVTLAGAAIDTARIVVLPFEHDGGAGLTDEDDRLRDAIRRWQGVDAVDRLETREALPRSSGARMTANAARDVGRAVRAARYIIGVVVREADSAVLRAGLYDARTGTSLTDATVSLPAGAAGRASAAFDSLADRLLFPDVPESTLVALRVNTHSRPALQAYAESRKAIAEWNLARADSGLAAATNYDPRFTLAYLWLAQVRSWRGLKPATWQFAIKRVATSRAQLGRRDRSVADALSAFAANDSARACEIWKDLTARAGEAADFAAWYDVALCDYFDQAVLRDPGSPSGWKFRSSYQQATLAFQRAFQILPAVHREFRSDWYASLKRLLRTQRTQLRLGVAMRPDTGFFAAYPSWSRSGDSLEFIPYPTQAFEAGRPEVLPATTGEAVEHQRRVFLDIATTWRSGFEPKADALLAVAMALDELDDPAALDSVHAARRLADEEGDRGARLLTGAAEVAMRVKRSVPNDYRSLAAARLVADSLLRSDGDHPDSANAMALASLAALTGHPTLAARLAAGASETVNGAPKSLVGPVRALQAFAALGAPVDSLRALTAAVLGAPLGAASADRVRLLRRAITLAFPVHQDSAVRLLARTGDFLAVAENAWLAHDTSTIRSRILPLRDARRLAAPEDLKLESLYPEAWLLASTGDPATALAWLTPTLDAQAKSSTENLRTVVAAGALLRSMVLRAELAHRLKRGSEAAQWARAVAALWADADEELRPVLREMRRIAK